MTTSVKFPDKLIQAARKHAEAYSRSVPKQIEHWSRIGRIAEDNPDLPYSFIQALLLSLEEARDRDVTEFQAG